jgi:hypothetical protein
MGCKYCNEKAESELVMRTGLEHGRLETITICTSCLWERVLSRTITNENPLQRETISQQKKPQSGLHDKS